MKKTQFIIAFIAILHPFFADAQWSVPISISPGSRNAQMNENMGPCIAVSGDTLHVIWSDVTTKGSAIYYIRSVDTGHTWTAPVAISDTNGRALMPSLAVSGSNIHVVWWDSLKVPTGNGLTGNSSFYKRSTDGGNTWGARVIIDSGTVFWPGVAASGQTVLISLDKGAFDSTIVCLTISTNNGTTFGPEQIVSTRTGIGRSEDQSTATDGTNIHMSWNDNRTGTMGIYYRHSPDMGLTWNTEVDLTGTMYGYSTMVSLESGHLDVVHGMGTPVSNNWISQSADSGNVWNANKYVIGPGYYPFLVRSGQDLHMVYSASQFDSMVYVHSGDGGATWNPTFLASTDHSWKVPFIALTCPVLHVVWADSGYIHYMRNPTGNSACPQAGCPNITVSATQIADSASAYATASGGVLPYTYSWSSSPAQTSDTATGLTIGNSYTVTVTDHNGCTSSASVSIVPNGIASIGGTNIVSIYPNPSNGRFTLSYAKEAIGAVLTIRDVSGRSILSSALNDNSGKMSINLESLSGGVYLWEVKSDATVYGNGKIVLINK